MNLKISLKKSIEKPSVLTITRSDESITWSKLHKGLETHDLAHFSVEKTLLFTHAFYSIIDNGYNVGDFELPKAQRPSEVQPENLHAEALITEHIVNLLEIELLNTGLNLNFISDLKQILAENNLPFPEQLNTQSLEVVRTQYYSLVNQWLVLEHNETMHIDFIMP